MAETSKGPLLTRRGFLERAVVAGILAVTGGSLGRAVLSVLSEGPASSRAAISGIEKKPQVEVDEQAVVDLAKIWTAGRAKIEPVPTATPTPTGKKSEKGKTPVPDDRQAKVNELNEILYYERAKEVLQFALVLKPELAKIKPRLAVAARFTDVGKTEPPLAEKNIRNDPENSLLLPRIYFKSGHFGPQEFTNLGRNRLIRLNMALVLALSVGESEKDSRPFSRLFSENWQDRWDWVNAHSGRDALRFLTGITDSQRFIYGLNSRGGVLPTEGTVYSDRLDDKLVVMILPAIMALRCYKMIPKKTETITDFAAVDASGNPDWQLISRWNVDPFLQAKFRQVYAGLVQFCQNHEDFKWLVTESIV